MLIHEVFDNPAPFQWIKDKTYEKIVTTTIAGRPFKAVFNIFNYVRSEDDPINTFYVSFVTHKKEDWGTGEGGAMQFASTLFNILDDAFANHGVQGIFIEVRPGPARIMVFNRILKRLAQKHNLKLYKEGQEFKHFWWYTK